MKLLRHIEYTCPGQPGHYTTDLQQQPNNLYALQTLRYDGSEEPQTILTLHNLTQREAYKTFQEHRSKHHLIDALDKDLDQ